MNFLGGLIFCLKRLKKVVYIFLLALIPILSFHELVYIESIENISIVLFRLFLYPSSLGTSMEYTLTFQLLEMIKMINDNKNKHY